MKDLCPHCGEELASAKDAFCSYCREEIQRLPSSPPPAVAARSPRSDDRSGSRSTSADQSDEFVTVARFDHLSDAAVLRAVLEENGIRCFVNDSNLIAVTSFFFSNAIGGIKVDVAASDAETAFEIYARTQDQERKSEDDPASAAIGVECEDCGELVFLKSSSAGKIESCPHCSAYLDVPEGFDHE